MVIVLIASLSAIFSIATTALGLKYYNEASKKTKSDRGFLIVNMIVSCVVLLACLVYVGLKLKGHSAGMPLSLF